MSTTRQQLERQAIAAHRHNMPWREFWRVYGTQVRALEPWDRDAYHRLVNKLLALVVSGDTDGQHPAGDGLEPWEADDARPHDTATAARLQLVFPSCEEPSR